MTIRRSFESFFGNRLRKKVRRPRTNVEKRTLLLEPLERRELLDADGLAQPFPDGLDHADLEVRQLITNITTTGDTTPRFSHSTEDSSPLIGLTSFRADSNFSGVDGSGFATVIIDTGIDLDHPFFGPDADSNGIADRIVFQSDFADNDNDASDTDDHGSNVASIAAASTGAFIGMAPGADIIALKVFPDGQNRQATSAAIEQALQWVVANATPYNIASVNMSLGDGQNFGAPTTSPAFGINDELAALVAMDVIVVSAAGNDFFQFTNVQGVAYPAADPNSIAVSATYDADVGSPSYSGGAAANSTGPDRVTPFSQRHAILTTIMAPGAEISGADRDGSYIVFSGTSQAAPHVAGVAVLAQQLAVQELARRLTQSEFVSLMQTTGVTINDGDDEDDNVINTGADFQRLDVHALGNAILALGGQSVSALLGPQLISINPNEGDIFNFDDDPGVNPGLDNILDVAPRELTLRFDGNSVIDAATLDGIRFTQSGFDGSFRDDFNTGGAVEVEVTQLDPLLTGLEVIVTKSGSLSGPALPTVSVSGMTISVELNVDPGNESSAADFVQALRASLPAAALVDVAVVAGDPTQDIATTADASTEIAPNIIISPGFIGFGESQRIVIARFAETLPDDLYRIEVFGVDDTNAGITGLKDTSGLLFTPMIEGTNRDTIFFELDLGAQIVAIVPQPVSRAQEVEITGAPTGGTFRLTVDGVQTGLIPFDVSAMVLQEDVLDNLPNVNPEDVVVTGPSGGPWNVVFQGRYAGEQVATMTADASGLTGGANPDVLVTAASLLSQARDQIIVYFNNDDLLDDVTSAENPDFYRLFLTNDTVRNTDDSAAHTPTSVAYYPDLDKAILQFAVPIDELSGPGTFRLRIGTDEATPAVPITVSVPADTTIPALPTQPGSSFDTALDIGGLTTTSVILDSSIDPQQFTLDFAGTNDEPGHRDIPSPPENHLLVSRDSSAAITTQAYNFQDVYGQDNFGNDLHNAITEAQKDRAREIFALYSYYLGIQFVETDASGFTVSTGDLTAVGLTSGPGGVLGVGGGGRLVMDAQDFTNPADDRPFASWFRVAIHEIGHLLGLQHASELPSGTVMRGTPGSFLNFGQTEEPDYPGDHDIVHGQLVFRTSSKDIDLFQFDVADTGVLTAETFAERLPDSSALDTQLRLYQLQPDGTTELVAQNDDYFSEDSLIKLDLTPGTYFIGVSASGNDDYDPNITDTGLGGRTDGEYELRLNFRPSVDNNIVDATGTDFDGNLDGQPGGVHNFWFQAKPLERILEITGNSTTFAAPGVQSVTIVNGQGISNTFPFVTAATVANNGIIEVTGASTQTSIRDDLIAEINFAFGTTMATLVGTTRMMLTGERNVTLGAGIVGINIEGRTIFVDKTAAANADGSLASPFNSIGKFTSINAFSNSHPGDIVRIVGNGGLDGDLNTEVDAFAYEIGFNGPPHNSELSDGATMEVPQGVAAMIDSGALFKLRQSRIGVGSSTASDNRSRAALQVLGTPVQEVFFNSFNNDALGIGQVTVPTTPKAGDWGGISFREDVDREQGRFLYEQEGIFLNYVNHADIQYGGGSVFIDSQQQIINPVHITQTRPTVTFNTITDSADAAISADPNAFGETNFHAPRYQLSGEFTSDYDRVGPQVHGNRVVDNSNNGLFVRIDTPTGGQIIPMTVSGRLDDIDITHIISQNLIIQGTPAGPLRVATPPPSNLITFVPQAGGSLAIGTYEYIVTFVDINGNEGPPSAKTDSAATLLNRTISGAPGEGTIQLNGLPPVSTGFVARRLYRSDDGGATFTLAAQIDGSAATYVDDGTTAEGNLVTGATVDLARLDARLAIDPGTIIKLENARIETTFGAQLIAEGSDGREIIFTTRLDDRYGTGGTFDTNNDDALGGGETFPTLADEGDWGGLYFGHTASGSIDHALITYAGGVVPLEGDFAAFNAIEIQQADVRIRNSVIEMNDAGTGGSAPSDRFGRLNNSAAAIYVRGSQPVILDNVVRDNDGPAISINANSFNYGLAKDTGRSTGAVDVVRNFFDNQGPLVRRNRLSSTSGVAETSGGINGMLLRGETLTTEVVLDDTDVVHVLKDTIYVPDFHSFGGLRLESSPTESLVVKLLGNSAGITATGNPLDIDDRIGGMLHVVGQPGFPVILTSLNDDAVGAGFQPNGLPQADTNNDGTSSGNPNDWRSLQLLTFSHDRNAEIVLELEAPEESGPGDNFTPNTAQFLGELAPNQKAGDDNVRLGFDIHGVISEPGDADVYSFVGTAGTDVFIDVDRTDHTLDTVVELVDVNGQIIAQSNDSDQETLQSRATSALEVYESNPAATDANLLQKSLYFPTTFLGNPKDHGTTNPRDAGFRVLLPGTTGNKGTYHVRIRSSNTANTTPQTAIDTPDLQDPSKLFDGITSGSYQLQIRLDEVNEYPGSTVRFADIRFANIGIDVQGAPRHSPLLGESGENNPDNNDGTPQPIGNILGSDRAAVAVSGGLSSAGDIDRYNVDANYLAVQTSAGNYTSATFDVDYADGIGRPNTSLAVFDGSALVLVSNDAQLTGSPTTGSQTSNSNIADDIPGPNQITDMDDLSRGSAGQLDPFIGPVELPTGATYTTVVTSNSQSPSTLQQFRQASVSTALAAVRLEPVNSVDRIAEDRIGGNGGSNVAQSNIGLTTILPTFMTTELGNSQEESVVPFHLGDIVLFTGTGSSVSTVNPFTGQGVPFVGTTSNRGFADLAMRPDGTLTALSTHNGGTVNDGTVGNLLQIHPGTGVATSLGDDGIATFEDDPGNLPSDRAHNRGVGFNAMAYRGDIITNNVRNDLDLYAIGSRDNGVNVPAAPATVSELLNVMYELEADNGAVDGAGNDRTDPGRNLGAGTQQREIGMIDLGGAVITGAAFIGPTMYAVADNGNLYTISTWSAAETLVGAVNDPGATFAPISFAGLSRGPRNVEGGAYADLLFGVSDTGDLYAFNTGGVLQPVFVDGQYTVDTGGTTRGIAFSNLDYNLWHTTTQRSANDGHGIDAAFDESRIPEDGGTSFYFGFDSTGRNNLTDSSSQPRNCPVSDTPTADAFICDTYDFPGGAHGSLESNPFSLKGYSSEDQPTLYFSYFLDTDNTNSLTDMQDSFRVFLGTEDGAWHIVATNNSARPGEFEDLAGGDDITVNVQDLYDVGEAGGPTAWRQSRVALAPFAGMENLRLRFDFATAGSMNLGDSTTTGDELRSIPGRKLRDGQTIEISDLPRPILIPSTTFEVDLGYTLVVPSGADVDVTDTFSINGTPFTFTAGLTAGTAIHVDDTLTANELADSIETQVFANAASGGGGPVGTFRNDNRINLSNVDAGGATATGLPRFIEGETGVGGGNVPLFINAGMTNEDVKDVVDLALETNYVVNPSAFNIFKDYDHIPRLINHVVIAQNAGPNGGQLFGLSQQPGGASGLLGDVFGSFNDVDPLNHSDRGMTNHNEGVYVDDIIIGFAERGEMVTDVPSQTGFDSVGSTGTLVGEYELEVRRSAIYGHNLPEAFAPPLQLPFRSFDTNDRLSQQSTITVPQGPDIYDGQTFVLSDGVDTLTFEFDDDDLDLIGFTDPQTGFGDGVAAGRVLVPFRPNWEDYQVAASVRDVVNSNQVQAVLEIIAGLADGKITGTSSTTDRVNLYGNVTANVFSEREVDDFGDPIATGVEEMSFTSFGVGEHGYSPPNLFSYPDFSGEYGGDQNRRRDEGQLLIHSNFVSRSGQFGIFIDADDRTAQGSIPNPGGVRHTRGINQERLVHSVTVINNVLDRNTSGGIRFSGQSNPNNQPQAPVPFGRIVNNTVYGLAQGDVGIQVDTSASPTVLNNILANLGTGVSIDGTSQTSVVGSNLYQNAPTAANEFSPIQLVAGDPLFLDAAASNFYLTSGSQAIDSSLDALNDRFDFFNSIKQPLGIAASPILAPDRDVVGQLRADGDGNSSGGGSNPLKDRGAFDRVDKFGPTAELLFPRGNDTTGDDIDATETVVRLTEGVLDHFDIVLFDDDGTGPDLNTLTDLSVSLTEDGRALSEIVDYTFGFNTTSRTIRLTPLSGIWKPGRTYEITLNNRDRFVVVAPDGGSVIDGDTFTISDATGSVVTYEYDSGYVVTVPKTLTLELPVEGALSGGISDGETFTIDDGLTPTTFEFDSNNNVSGSNVRIGFTNADLQTELVNAVIDAIDGLVGAVGDSMFGLGLSPRDLGAGVIHLGSRTNHTLTLSGSGILTSSGSPAGVDDGDTFIIDYNGQIVRFEFDENGSPPGTNEQISFTFFETNEEIADKIANKIVNFNPMVTDQEFTLIPVHLGGGRIHIGGEVGLGLDTAGSGLFQVGAPGVQGSLMLTIPAAGSGGGITDGEIFTISNGGTTITFEFNADGVLTPGNTPINFSDGSVVPPSTQLEIAASVASVIAGVEALGLTPTDLLNGQIRLNESASYTVDTTLTNVATTGVSGGAVAMSFIPDVSFGGDQMAGVIINTVNSSSTLAFARLRAGSTVFISDAIAISGIRTISSAGNPLGQLEGIKDIAGNDLQPNRANNETQFTIILAGAELDYGDAPDPLAGLAGKYPTLRANDGARHVLVPDQIFLGAGVDSEFDGQPTRVADGDDADHVLDVSGSNLSAAGLAPFNVSTAVQLAGEREGTTFTLIDGANSVTFEFDLDSLGMTSGDVAIPFSTADSIDTIVDSIVTAVEDRLVPMAPFPLVGFNPTNLGGGQLYLGGGATHTIGLGTSNLAHTGQLPARITAVGAGLAVQVPALSSIMINLPSGWLSAVGDGERFTIDDGVNPPVTFEFEETSAGTQGVDDVNRAIVFSAITDTNAVVATAVETAITQSFVDGDLIDLMPSATGNTVNLLGATTDTSVDVPTILSPNLGQLNPVANGHAFTIDDGVSPVTFEFDAGGPVSGTPIPFSLSDSANDIANSIVDAIDGLVGVVGDGMFGLGLNPVNLGDAMIDLGGTVSNVVDLTLPPPGSLNLLLTGTPGGIADGQIFTIDDGNRLWTFEFDQNASSVAVGNIPVTYLAGSSASDISAAITMAVNASAVGVAATDSASGTVDLARDDEDGVSFDYVINPNVVTPITVEASSSGLLDGWIDYNQDGDWDDFGEKIFDSVVLTGGANSLEFTAPGFALVGETFTRFRFSVGGRTFPTGVIINGEVEDYLVSITPGTPPVVVNDMYTTDEETQLNEITVGPLGDGVLANDQDTENQNLVVSEVNGMASNVDSGVTLEHGGTVTVDADGTFLYDPTTSTTLNQMAVGEVMTESFTYRANDVPTCGPPCTTMISNNTATVVITINGVNDPPVITSNGGGATAAVNVDENTTDVTTVTATDLDLPADTLTFSLPLGGASDQALFSINGSSGALAFLTAPNFEIPTDDDTDGVYELKVMVSDGNGGTDMQTI
ncbi:MAG: hypothetical protein CMJ50_03755, partial [Planctomycetaceae bacterium]|nr:hypothetical protein [Planctomycetaceae bacterium]